MVVVELAGGIGNQLFEYAAGRQLALRYGTPLILDPSWFERPPETDTPREYALGAFRIHGELRRPGAWARLRLRGRTVTERTPFRTDPDFERIRPPVRLRGYWQSPGYVEPIRDVLLAELQLREPLSPSASALAGRIGDASTVAVHVRRGDYVAKPETTAFHGICSTDYYREAVGELARRVGPAHHVVFSDDPAWCREHLGLGVPLEVAEGHAGHEDLKLMALCDHHVIANSSFSWWGAWLCQNPGQTVIAPRRWVRAPDFADANPAPPDWILI